jgi:hypothetical protein
MLRLVALVRTDVSEELSATIIRVGSYGYVPSSPIDSYHPDDGGPKFLRNVGSYKSHTA